MQAKKYKVMTILGTRPELIKLSRVIAELEEHTHHILVSTGQNYDYELNEVFYKDLQVRKPDYFLEIATGHNVAQDIANAISRIDPILEKEQPDAVLFYGDTNSTLAAITVKRRKIPIFHMEAGNRCFDLRVPEEINRKIIDHISDINIVLSEHARRYLIAEGIRAETIFKTGSCMQEIYQYYAKDIAASEVLKTLKLKEKNYFIVSAHREDNVDDQEQLIKLLSVLNSLAENYNKRVILSTHPRTRKRLEALAEADNMLAMDQRVEFMKPFGFIDYVHLMQNAYCVLSDSGSLTEDATLLDVPAVTIRRMHERPEGMDVAAILMSILDPSKVLAAVDIAVAHAKDKVGARIMDVVPDYDVDCVSKKVVRIIVSYVDYIKRTVWHEA